jgi:ankyrin repeat protein
MNCKATFSLVTLLTLFSFGKSIFAMKNEINIFQAVKEGDLEAVRIFLKNKGGVNCRTKDQLTPLHFAAWSGNTNTVKLLLNNGANINCEDNFNRTPLHWAAWAGSLGVVISLLQKKADSTCKTKEGQTPLHFAAFKGHRSIVQLLLKNGAEINSKDSHGCTPLHVAVSGPQDDTHDETVSILLLKNADTNYLNNEEKTVFNLADEAKYSLAVQLITDKEKLKAQGNLSSYLKAVEEEKKVAKPSSIKYLYSRKDSKS